MKKGLWLLSLLWVLFLSWCWWSVNVVEYNDSLVDIVKECTDSNQELFKNFNTDEVSVDSILQSIQDSITICQGSQVKASQIWNYEKDSSLKDAVVDLLALEIDYLQKFSATSRYRNIDNITEEDREEYNWIVSDLNETQNSLNQQFTKLQEVQEGFAAKHALKLE
jgi:hypothetical protein